MQRFAVFISYVFHPLFIPVAGTVAYYLISPKYHEETIQKTVIFSVIIISVLIPILFFILLKNIGWVKSVFLKSINERKIPLYTYILLLYILIYNVISPAASIELYYFFVGLLGSAIACLVLVYFKFKASMHLMGISGLTLFVLGLSIHYAINVTFAISMLVLGIGAITSARLFLKAHDTKELVFGACMGIFPQLITFSYWL